MTRVGLIGYGYWGPNLARNFQRCPESELVRIVDLNPARLEAVKRDWPEVDASSSVEDLTRASDIDAIAIATPIQTHYKLALEALQNGKHVLVEKPMADSSAACEHLIEEAT